VTDESLVEALAQIVEKMKLIFQPVKNDPSYNPEDFKQTAKGVANYINLNLMDKSILLFFFFFLKQKQFQFRYQNRGHPFKY
jgi:hypothetical protein